MILNTYAVLTVFIALVRLLLGVVLLGMALVAWRGRPFSASAEGREVLEDRTYLVFLLTLLLLALNLLSWPLLYLLLQSYVPEWSGVMCIYGVTQIGAGSQDSSRFLPQLLALLQWTKPALVFVGGVWFVTYLVNRRTQTAPLLPRLFLILCAVGALATADSLAELAYVVIPKKEALPTGGCCTTAFDDRGAVWFLPHTLQTDAARVWLYVGYYAANFMLMLLVGLAARRARSLSRRRMILLFAAGVITLGVSGSFLVEVAAPVLLHLPFHHCPYDLIPTVPETIVAIALHILAFFSLGWAALLPLLGRDPETAPFWGD